MGNTSSLRAWSWCIGMFMLAIVVGGIVAIWWFTRGNPAHGVPVAIGGGWFPFFFVCFKRITELKHVIFLGASETMTMTTTTKPIPTPVRGVTSTVDRVATTQAKATVASTATKKASVSAAATTSAKAKRSVGDSVLPVETTEPSPSPTPVAPERRAIHNANHNRRQQQFQGRLR